ncbi:MAG TPA: hypothetical protein VGX69_01760 [Solirubrobacteraceae bacterium]|jgi:hypothetical protein|nr:hypothetical protein [Solirubrobacteraceae bacterium]
MGVLAGTGLAPAASANIVIGQSIAGVKLGATKAQVKHALGAPSSSDPTDFFYPTTTVGLRIGFSKAGRVNGVLSFLSKQKTSKGITIGSSRARLKSAYPQASCLEGPYGPNSLYCAVTAHFHGRKSFTGFLFGTATGGIEEIELGYGIGIVQEAHKA